MNRLKVSVADLRKRLGQQLTCTVNAVLPRLEIIATHSTQDPCVGELVFDSIERGVAVTGDVKFFWEGECRRCLETTKGSQSVRIDEIFQVDASQDDEVRHFDGVTVDLEPVLTEAIAFSLPLAPLCKASCGGPAPDEFPAFIGEAPEMDKEEVDPRWDALKTMKFE